MSSEYLERIKQVTGFSSRDKFQNARAIARAQAKRQGLDLWEVYKRERLLTPTEIDRGCLAGRDGKHTDERRAQWRESKRRKRQRDKARAHLSNVSSVVDGSRLSQDA